MSEGEPKPWERPGYSYGGPLDGQHTNRGNTRWLEETRHTPPAPKGDIGASAVIFARFEGDISMQILDSQGDIASDDFDLIRQQHAHLR